MTLKNPLLKKYWFYTGPVTGYGVTAFSLEDARSILKQEYSSDFLQEIKGVIENVDISELDHTHVLKNIGLSNFRGIWYPRLNV